MQITTGMIVELRKQTNAGIMDCKNALKESGGDIEKAKKILREKGILKMLSRKDRLSDEGQIYAYIHPGGKVGVLVEISSETDFVSKSGEFQKLLKETALQCAGMKPLYVDREDVPAESLEEEKKLLEKTHPIHLIPTLFFPTINQIIKLFNHSSPLIITFWTKFVWSANWLNK